MQLVNDILNKIYLSIEEDGYLLIEKIGNISEEIFDSKPLSLLFDEKVEIFIHSISLFLIFIFLAYFAYYLMFSKNNSLYINFKMVIQCIVICIISLNSYTICREIVKINNMFTIGIEEILENFVDGKIEYMSLKKNVNTLEEYLKEQDKISILGIKDGIISLFLLLLITVFSIRYVIFILLVIVSPFVMITILHSKTQIIFNKWLKYLLYSIAVQNVNKLLLFICICTKEDKEIYGCILLGAIILIYKLNRKVGDI